MTRARQAVLIALAVSVSACGQDGAAEPPVVANVSLAVTNAALFSGDTTSALVTLSDANGRVLTGRAVTWQSSATTVATVSGTGSQVTVTAVAPGTTVISANSDGATGSAAVVVNDRTSTLPVLTFSPGTVQFTRAGETQTVTLSGSSGFGPVHCHLHRRVQQYASGHGQHIRRATRDHGWRE